MFTNIRDWRIRGLGVIQGPHNAIGLRQLKSCQLLRKLYEKLHLKAWSWRSSEPRNSLDYISFTSSVLQSTVYTRDGHRLGPSTGWVGSGCVEFFGNCRGLGSVTPWWVGSDGCVRWGLLARLCIFIPQTLNWNSTIILSWKLSKTVYHVLCHTRIKIDALPCMAVKWVGWVGPCAGTMGWVG